MARKFLYAVALLVVVVIGALMGLRFWAKELSQFAFVPSARFAALAPMAPAAWDDPALWISRAGGHPGDPARWLPAGASEVPELPAAVFFIHPTSSFDRTRWNAPVDDALAATRAEIFARGLASPFGAARELWAPRYRQATFGAFLTDRADGTQALEAAYADVLAAFDHFAAHADPALPIVLVGHSQGALHLMKLMQQRVAGKPLAARIAAAYVVGWPVSLAHDLPEMGLPACTRSDEAGCVLSWQSFAEPADPSMVLDAYARLPGLDGKNRKGSPFLCINPITGRPGDAAEGWANIGTLVPDATLAHGALMPGLVPARCAPNGFLLVGPPPQMGPYVLPGNNYHVYDIPLFWANVRADVTRRVNSWQAAHRAPPTTAEGKTAAAETPAASRHARSWWPWRRG
ncbi:MAG TPA: DUF3089 domain-containing protein [Novosphingobium sp.]|nr:DUF3089 domain-containing protein [Novosphingobium sp.]